MDEVLIESEQHIAKMIAKKGLQYFYDNICKEKQDREFALYIDQKYNAEDQPWL